MTKSTVKDSGMGKAIGSVEKHRLCKDTPNESAIKNRVQQVKDAWHASVKARKPLDLAKDGSKRASDSSPTHAPSVKRIKVEIDPKKSSSFSTLLKKVSGLPNGAPASGLSVSANEKWSASSASSLSKTESISNSNDEVNSALANGHPEKKGEHDNKNAYFYSSFKTSDTDDSLF